jgi:hypothetical protein
MVGGKVRVAFCFTISGGRIAAIDLIGEPAAIADLEVKTARSGLRRSG